ncbi:RNA polymerase sigma factor [Pirellulimonas nuda]|uniref:RNA polymerase sigma factor n=2 Tax=Pirellulimonas nuda TaxID=2528009 RepID=A0A518DAP6_9BACT|nr:RNA polymerase sigma factor [Pirellulimonas nuda]
MAPDQRTEEFLVLYNQEQRAIYAYIRALLFARDDAEDVFQDTCIALWRSFDQYQPGTNFGAWAREIARYRVLAHGKKKLGDRHVFQEEIVNSLADELQANATVYEQRQRALEDCLGELRKSDRELLFQRYAGGATTVELANRLQRPLSTLYKSLRRIRHSLLGCVKARIVLEEQAG